MPFPLPVFTPFPIPFPTVAPPVVYEAAQARTHAAWTTGGVSCRGRSGLGSDALERSSSELHLSGRDVEKLPNCSGSLHRDYEGAFVFDVIERPPTGALVNRAELRFFVRDSYRSSAHGSGGFQLPRAADGRVMPCPGYALLATQDPRTVIEGQPLGGALQTARFVRAAQNGLVRIDVTKAVQEVFAGSRKGYGFVVRGASDASWYSDDPGFQDACINLISSPQLAITY